MNTSRDGPKPALHALARLVCAGFLRELRHLRGLRLDLGLHFREPAADLTNEVVDGGAGIPAHGARKLRSEIESVG